MTPGPMRVGWARIDCDPGYQIGSDENSWAFDGFNVRFIVESIDVLSSYNLSAYIILTFAFENFLNNSVLFL